MSRSGKQTHLPGEASIRVRGDRNQEARSFAYSGALARRGVDQGPRRQESAEARVSRSGIQTHSPREASISVRGDRNQPRRVVSRSGKQTHSPGEASISVRGDRNQEARSVAQWQTNALARRGVDQCPRRQESGGA